jgi:hypothetical protein
MSESRSLLAYLVVLGVLCMTVSAALAAEGPAPAAPATTYFAIKVVDEQTGRGVPLVELKTTNSIRYYTDSAGLVAFHEPGLMGQKVFFSIQSHGYEFPKDGFGCVGKALVPTAGGSAEIKIKRKNIAERLYRITGGGIYRDSVLLGRPTPIREPLLNGKVFGQDSTLTAVYGGKVYWFWGDTSRPTYPLGHFRMAGATSQLPGRGGLDPGVGVDLTYFVDAEGFSRPMCPMPAEEGGPIWIDGVLTVADESGPERLIGHYSRMKSLDVVLNQGLVIYDDKANVFRKLRDLPATVGWRCPREHPTRWQDGGREYFLFPVPFPTVRVRADLKSIQDLDAYEAFTPLAPGSKYDKAAAKVERDAAGKLVYGWKPNTEPINTAQERELIAAGRIQAEEARFQLRDAETSKPVDLHKGSVYWNAYRKKWLAVAVQFGGSSSFLGEVWLAESAEPTGPWQWARKIVTHEKYTFYNPVQHPFLDAEGGKVIYFEGTYANTFSGNADQTPRYDYNQIMYRLDLSDPRLPQPLGPTTAPGK